MDPLLRSLVDANDDVRVVFRHFPLTHVHDHALKAAEASEAAGAQGKFWEYHDLLFENQEQFASGDAGNAREIFIELAEQLELDVEQFTQELDEGVYEPFVLTSQKEAAGLSLPGTTSPHFEWGIVGTNTTKPIHLGCLNTT